MMEVVKNVCLYIVVGLLVNWSTNLIKSSFLILFLEKNIITLLVALLAINTTTMSIMMVKLRELKDKFEINFDKSINSMKISIYEQVVLIPISIFVLVARDSIIIKNYISSTQFIFDTVLISIFAYAIHILFDTARGIFVIMSSETNK